MTKPRYNTKPKFGVGRVRGVLNYSTLSEQKAWVDACINEEINPFVATAQVAKDCYEMFQNAKAMGDHKSAGAWMTLLDNVLGRMQHGLLPPRRNMDSNNDVIALLPQVSIHPDVKDD